MYVLYFTVNPALTGKVTPVTCLGGDDPPAQRLDLLDRVREVVERRHRIRHRGDLVADVHRVDVGALFGQPDRVAAALAACRPGDEGDLALNSSSHLCYFWFPGGVSLLLAAAWLLGDRGCVDRLHPRDRRRVSSRP
jgi:hypothetical protein